jgi:hemolysin activation/secretion protein
MVTQEHRVDTQNVPLDEYYDYFSDDSENVHTSAGVGLKVSLNANFVVSADWGKALNRNDGESGVYVQMNYLF